MTGNGMSRFCLEQTGDFQPSRLTTNDILMNTAGMTKLKSSVGSIIFFQREEDMWLWGDEKVSVCPKAQFIISIKDEEAWIMMVIWLWTNNN